MTVRFDLDAVDVPDDPSVIFTLDGREWVCRHRLSIPAGVVDGLMGAVPMRLDTIWRGLLAATVERDGVQVDQGDEFVALLARTDSPLTVGRAEELTRQMVEVIFNRPTLPSGRSATGRQPTDGTSKAGSSSRAARPKKRAS